MEKIIGKTEKTVSLLAVCIILLAAASALTGVCSQTVRNIPDVTSSYGENVALYRIGLYARDSVSMASQAIAQDFVTLIVGIPLLGAALFCVNRKHRVRAWILLTGTLGYFLYTYTSYSVLAAFNRLYIVYVILMALSFYAFILSLAFLKRRIVIEETFSEKYPVKSLSVFLFLVGLMLCIMWSGRIFPALATGTAPYGLEHYSTPVIQSLDLGFIVPACFVSSYLLSKRKAWGYLLSAVLVMKMLTMAAAVSAMAINMMLHQVEMGLADKITFPVIVLINICFLVKMLKAVNNTTLNT